MGDPSKIREIASGLLYPEGPIAMEDGSILLVEIKRGTLTRINQDGSKEIVAETGGGPNGAAIGPDGNVYICNSGGFEWHEIDGKLVPGDQPADYKSGSIQRVNLDTGKVETLYTEHNGQLLRGPNDLVFDTAGGFYFTDCGKKRERDHDRTGVYYATPDGSMIKEVIFPMDAPNGIGLSPDGKRLYVSETFSGRVWYWDVAGPGELIYAESAGQTFLTPGGGTLLAGLPGYQGFDSLALDSEGNICVATLFQGGITIISPDGSSVEQIPMPDPLATNICFGGDDLRTAYITLAGYGHLVTMDWPRPGLKLNY